MVVNNKGTLIKINNINETQLGDFLQGQFWGSIPVRGRELCPAGLTRGAGQRQACAPLRAGQPGAALCPHSLPCAPWLKDAALFGPVHLAGHCGRSPSSIS